MNGRSAFLSEDKESRFGLNAFALKMIALVTMVIDHVGAVLMPESIALRIIGRIAFPVYAFLITEGFFHTKDVKKYMKRLLVFAFLSEIPFDLAVSGEFLEFEHQNVFFTLFGGLFLMYLYNRQTTTGEKIIAVLLVTTLGDVLRTDYGAWGILMIFCFYIFREKFWAKLISVSCINVLAFGYIQSYAVLAFVPIALYNGKKGPGLKYFFYWIYPVHLLVLYIIKLSL